jgi:hypothetical protein
MTAPMAVAVGVPPASAQGRAGFGPVGLILVATVLATGLNFMMGQIGALQTTATRLLRVQQTNHLIMQTAMRLAAEAADLDGDGYRETPVMRFGAGGPSGGGLVPLSSAAGKTDAWGRPIGYCAWNYGNATSLTGLINPGRSSTNATEIVMMVVSSGADGIFQTVCPTDPQTVVPTAGGDDILVGFTAAEVAQRASITDEMLAFLNALIGGEYRNGTGGNLDIAGTLTVGSALGAGAQALIVPDGKVQALNRRLSQAVYDVATARPGDQVAQPSCPSGLVPEIYVALMHVAADSAGTPFSAAQAYATPVSAGGSAAWRIGVDIRTQNGWVTPSPADVARVMVITKCS